MKKNGVCHALLILHAYNGPSLVISVSAKKVKVRTYSVVDSEVLLLNTLQPPSHFHGKANPYTSKHINPFHKSWIRPCY